VHQAAARAAHQTHGEPSSRAAGVYAQVSHWGNLLLARWLMDLTRRARAAERRERDVLGRSASERRASGERGHDR